MKVLGVLIGAIIAVAVVVLYGAFAWGLVTYNFYHWFGMSLFPFLPNLNYMECVTLGLFLTIFKTHSIERLHKNYQKDESEWWAEFIVAPWIMLLFGWLFTFII